MNESFGELLKALEADLDKTYLQRTDATKEQIDFYLKGKRIEFEKFRHVLGEWALKRAIKKLYRGRNETEIEIACHCLGEKKVGMAIVEKVKRRLKAVCEFSGIPLTVWIAPMCREAE